MASLAKWLSVRYKLNGCGIIVESIKVKFSSENKFYSKFSDQILSYKKMEPVVLAVTCFENSQKCSPSFLQLKVVVVKSLRDTLSVKLKLGNIHQSYELKHIKWIYSWLYWRETLYFICDFVFQRRSFCTV